MKGGPRPPLKTPYLQDLIHKSRRGRDRQAGWTGRGGKADQNHRLARKKRQYVNILGTAVLDNIFLGFFPCPPP